MILCFILIFLYGCERENVDSDKENKTLKNMATVDIPKINNAEKNAQSYAEISPEVVDPERINQEVKEQVFYQEIEWDELIPKIDLDVLLNPPEYIMAIEDGSIEDQLTNSKQSGLNIESKGESDYEKALISTNIIEGMDGKNIEIPGFIVPVEFNEKQIVTSFFLVPYFGACLHMPPPPPNQVIYIEIEDGFALAQLYEPVVVSGKLSVELVEEELATSAYTMTMDNIRLYYENE